MAKFERGSKKHICPDCKQKTFVRYVYERTGEYLPAEFGKCDRANNCGYFKPPGADELKNTSYNFKNTHQRQIPQPPPIPDFVPNELFDRYQLVKIESNLHKFFVSKFGPEVANDLHSRYKYGTALKGVFEGAVIFWQIDVNNKIRSGKIIQYNRETGRRIKDNGFPARWVHTALNTPEKEFQLVQCFFGEHLLSENDLPVAICESEKTAMVASVYFPGFVWLATGGSAGCKWTEYHVCRVLRKRKVVIFPDLGIHKATGETYYQYWSRKAAILRGHGLSVSVSSFLENSPKVTEQERKSGFDLADFLLQLDYKEFLSLQKPKESTPIIDFIDERQTTEKASIEEKE